MDQLRHIGEVVGSFRALMVLADDIPINQRQCILILDIFSLAFDTISDEIRHFLKLEEKHTKWKPLEQPLRELYRVFKEGEIYVRQCLDNRNWLCKAIALHQNKDSVEFHIHNLLNYFPAVIEAIETAGEISGLDHQEMQRRKIVLGKKYDADWNDPKLFQFQFGKQYLVPPEICTRFSNACKEDKWCLIESLKENKSSSDFTKTELRLADCLLKKINGLHKGKLFPSSILLGADDYQIRRRLGSGNDLKEIQWMGEVFAMRHFYGDIEPEVTNLLSLSHPNILQYLCGFYDEGKKETFFVSELMSKDLFMYLKENCGPRRRILFSLPVVVDLMLQISRGMEFLHSQKICHGSLNTCNVFLKTRSSTEGFFHAKVSGFGLSSIKTQTCRSPVPQIPPNPFIWYAPEVLAEQERNPDSKLSKFTEKADVYSFGMLCFELLTGKVPFEDSHLQGQDMARNIRAGERPLFPFPSPKYLVNLTKKCWHTDPNQRPSFSSICRILRYIKKFLVVNPEYGELDMLAPSIDYCEIESGFLRRFFMEDQSCVGQIPFQMFAYRLAEKGKVNWGRKDKGSDQAGNEECVSVVEDPILPPMDTRSVCLERKINFADTRSVCTEVPDKRSLMDRKVLLEERITPIRKLKKTPAPGQQTLLVTSFK
ncbi:hypothetical protein ACFE04_004889 [Oxalis oulophora]